MSKERKPRLAQRLQTDRGLYRALQRWGYYLLALMAWVTVVLAVSALGVLVCSRLTWYETDPLYHLLLWVRDYYFFFCIAVVLLGWVVISWHFISRPVRQLDALIGASAQLTRPTEEPIRLPAALKAAEDELNLAREQALRSAYVAREAEQRKNDLIVYLAHDLKTPLTSVVGYLTLLQEEPDLSPEMRARYTGVALDKALRLEDLINEFFEITRFNLSAIELERERVDFSRMLEQMMWEFKPLMADKNLEWQAQLTPKVLLTCDPGKMERVLDNLIRNAISYSEPGSPLILSLAEQEGKVIIRLENRGRTIPPEALARLFERFYRTDSDRARSQGGYGLGLSIAKSIADGHRGRISVSSSAISGTLFTVRLPLPGRGLGHLRTRSLG